MPYNEHAQRDPNFLARLPPATGCHHQSATVGLVTVMFGTHWLAMLFGFALLSHQPGGFLGVWLGGVLLEHTQSYDAVWWLAILFGHLSAAINLPIVGKPVQRPAARSCLKADQGREDLAVRSYSVCNESEGIPKGWRIGFK